MIFPAENVVTNNNSKKNMTELNPRIASQEQLDAMMETGRKQRVFKEFRRLRIDNPPEVIKYSSEELLNWLLSRLGLTTPSTDSDQQPNQTFGEKLELVQAYGR